MGKDIWVGMMTSEDITVESDTMVGEPEVKLIAGGAAAVVVYTTHSKFTYKGTANDDIAKFSLMLEKQADGSWKIVHAHRGAGQKPDVSA